MKIIVDKVFNLNIMTVMKIQHGDKKKVADWLGISPQHFSNIATGRRKPGRSLAVMMQTLAGTKVAKWEDSEGGESVDVLIHKIYKAWFSSNGKSRHRKSCA